MARDTIAGQLANLSPFQAIIAFSPRQMISAWIVSMFIALEGKMEPRCYLPMIL
jgi:hypothetical protein